MVYVLQADGPESFGSGAVVKTRREALAIAVKWIEEGRTGIKIIGDRRVYRPEEFALTIGDP